MTHKRQNARQKWGKHHHRNQCTPSHRQLLDGFNLPSPQIANLTRVKHLPGIELDQSDSLEDFGSKSTSLVGYFDAFPSLGEHYMEKEKLNGET